MDREMLAQKYFSSELIAHLTSWIHVVNEKSDADVITELQ